MLWHASSKSTNLYNTCHRQSFGKWTMGAQDCLAMPAFILLSAPVASGLWVLLHVQISSKMAHGEVLLRHLSKEAVAKLQKLPG